MQTLPLWPVMFYDFQWKDHRVHRQQLVDICLDLEKRQETSGVAPGAKRGLYESKFDFVTIPDPAVESFANFAKDCFFKAAADANKKYWSPGMNITVEIHESWCHVTHDGGYHDMHIHPNSSWSAIYYLEVGDVDANSKNGVNRFYNPHHSMYLDAGTAWVTANNSIDIIPEPGMMVVFPSWIQHSALPYYGKRDRVVIALNCKINRIELGDISLPV
jgi:uncharacterized protein (TIGR02466 family)